MKHRVQIRDYRRAMGSAVRNLPDGRKLILRDEDSIVVDQAGEEMAVFSSDLKALVALSEMSFPKRCRFSEWSEV
jgi:hypothetical protein